MHKFTANFIRSAASETENPRLNIAKAVRRVFYRICIFYVILGIFSAFSSGTDDGCLQILGIFVTGLIVPYNDPSLLQCKTFTVPVR
jgi:amino acid transporter